ncbi:MAG: Abi family protein [Nocardioides sp.]|uniref:Abi family protein n=1 Tax=Nocardioides sp. TaxID=35761 RepID=UPI00238C26C3|nr:Abi family protein [Nocardioides sp.]MDE0775654.1 Abi family protein [Nocardioides sp.]
MARPPRPRGTLIYSKPALTHDELVDRWVERGLEIPDRARALRYARQLGYFRLSPYTIPFQRSGATHQFRRGVRFDDVLDLYVFDRELRLLVIDALERVEVAVRSALTDHMSSVGGGPHWWIDPNHFRDPRRHGDLVSIVRKTCNDQLQRGAETSTDELMFRSALEHYLTTYGTPELPPSWLMVETLTIGQLDALIRNLANKSDRTAVARSLGINDVLLESWLRTYVRVRNICAHHGRLWNVGLGVYPAIPISRKVHWLSDAEMMNEVRRQRLYPVLTSLQSILTTISPNSSWSARLRDLLARHPNVPLRAMGVPDDWLLDPFWRVGTERLSED